MDPKSKTSVMRLALALAVVYAFYRILLNHIYPA